MTARTGKEFIEGLKDERTVWLGNSKVSVTEDPRFKGSVQGMAGYFDWQHKYADDCLVEDTVTGKPMSASLIIPRNADDLAKRRRCYDRLARYGVGMLGRTPDYCNTTLAGQAGRADIWANSEKPQFHENLKKFHREVIEGDLSLTHTIIHAAVDRSIPELSGSNADLTLKVVKRDANGITVRGGKILATLGPFSDEMFVYPAAPIGRGFEDYAMCFSVPVSTKGVIQICRDHYGVDAPRADLPFSSRFDEQDAFVIFDDVEVPWERVFCDGQLDVYNGIAPGVFPGCVLQQTSTRAGVKLEFAYDLCVSMAKVLNIVNRPDVAQMLGEIWSYVTLTKSAARDCEARAYDWGSNCFFPHEDQAAIRSNMSFWMSRINDIIKTIGGHNLLSTPSLEAFDNPEISGLLERYLPGACGISAQERARVFRTAWDFAGSALGSRVELYERYYLGSRQRCQQTDNIVAQKTQKWGQLDEFLRESGVLPQS